MMKKSLWLTITAMAVLAGCSSTDADQQRQIEMLAQSRASVLSSGLPVEQGPLSIMKAAANKGTVEIMMIYNTDAKGAKPLDTVLRTSMNFYCTDREVKSNLEMGLSYRIKIRNSRGQLMVDQIVTKDYCDNPTAN